MKKLVFSTIACILWCISVLNLNAQTFNTNLKEGDPVPQWLIDEQATYNEVKQKFIDHYGEEKENWPEFIQECERLFEQFQEYNSKQKNPSSLKINKFFNNELKLGYDTTKQRSYYENHINTYRNYSSLLYDYTYSKNIRSTTNRWSSIKSKGTPTEKTFVDAESKDGILPLVLFTYTKDCPIGLLDWYFEDVFPVIALLYQQDNLSELVKILNSVQIHIKKLIDNHDFAKAKVWENSTYSFINPYHFERLKPELPNKFYRNDQWNNYKYIEEKQDEAIEQFNTALTNNLANYLAGRSFTLNFYGNDYWSPKITTVGELVINADASYTIKYNQEFLDEYNTNYGADIGYLSSITRPHSFLIPPIHYKNRIPSTDIFTNSKVLIDNGNYIIFFVIEDSVYANRINNKGHLTIGEQNYLFAITERCSKGLNYVYNIPHLAHFHFDHGEPMERSSMNLPFEEKVTHRIQQWIIYAFQSTVDEVLNNVTIVPQIYGMKYDKKRRTRIAIAAKSLPREVKTDGKSTTEIIATCLNILQTLISHQHLFPEKIFHSQLMNNMGLLPARLIGQQQLQM